VILGTFQAAAKHAHWCNGLHSDEDWGVPQEVADNGLLLEEER
jgi:hypothetical protein